MNTLQEINFWKRLEMFISDIQVNDQPGYEEKEMILGVCKKELSPVSNLEKSDAVEFAEWLLKKGSGNANHIGRKEDTIKLYKSFLLEQQQL